MRLSYHGHQAGKRSAAGGLPIDSLPEIPDLTKRTLRVALENGTPVHFFFECLAYTIAFAMFRALRKESDPLPSSTRWSLVAAAIIGAMLGSKILHHLANPSKWGAYTQHPWLLLGGKTIVGALLGGWVAVEIVKARLDVKVRTGDIYVLPLIAGISIGRIGCFFTGLTDGTAGVVTEMPWAVDFGDGLLRHPTQLYEIAFLVLLGVVLVTRESPHAPSGIRFRAFILTYLTFRLIVDFFKPYDQVLGLNPIQWACLISLFLCAGDLPAIFKTYGLTPKKSLSEGQEE